MDNLREMNGRKIEAFCYGSSLMTAKHEKLEYELKIEHENGEMGIVPKYYIVGKRNGIEVQRWNFYSVDRVCWAIDSLLAREQAAGQ